MGLMPVHCAQTINAVPSGTTVVRQHSTVVTSAKQNGANAGKVSPQLALTTDSGVPYRDSYSARTCNQAQCISSSCCHPIKGCYDKKSSYYSKH